MRPRAWIRLFSYAAIGVAGGYLLLAFMGIETRLASLFACGVTALIAWYFRGRGDGAPNPSLGTGPDGEHSAYGEFLQERWNEDVVLPSSVTGVRGLPASSENWGTPEIDSKGPGVDDINRG